MIKDHLKHLLYERLAAKEGFTTRELLTVLGECLPGRSETTLRWWINALKRESFFYQRGYGHYTLRGKPDFHPRFSLKAKRLYNLVSSIMDPGRPMALFESQVISMLLELSPQRNYYFVHVPRGEMEKVFYELQNRGRRVVLHPGKEIKKRYVLPFNEVIMIYPLLQEMPLAARGNYTGFTLEGVLVHTFIYGSTFFRYLDLSMDQLFVNAFDTYHINQQALLRYAGRRNRRQEISRLLERNGLLL